MFADGLTCLSVRNRMSELGLCDLVTCRDLMCRNMMLQSLLSEKYVKLCKDFEKLNKL